MSADLKLRADEFSVIAHKSKLVMLRNSRAALLGIGGDSVGYICPLKALPNNKCTSLSLSVMISRYGMYNFCLSAGGKWRTMLGISIIPPFIILSSLCLLPESPRWLLGKGREREAFIVLCRVRSYRRGLLYQGSLSYFRFDRIADDYSGISSDVFVVNCDVGDAACRQEPCN